MHPQTDSGLDRYRAETGHGNGPNAIRITFHCQIQLLLGPTVFIFHPFFPELPHQIRDMYSPKEADVLGYDFQVITGNINKPLAKEICQHLDIDLGEAEVTSFPGGETSVQIRENVRGNDVYIVQPVCGNGIVTPNDALMEILILIDAARRASARRITAVLPRTTVMPGRTAKTGRGCPSPPN